MKKETYATPSSIQVSTSAGPSYLAPSSTSGVLSLSTPTIPELDGIHSHRRPTKRKKIDEVNAADILPDGLQRSHTKSLKATAALESI